MSINVPFRLFPTSHLRYSFHMASQSKPTLDEVLSDAERLPAEDQRILADILRRRHIQTWRSETAAAARQDIADFEAGKLKPESAEDIIARLNRPE
jgi:hypothetical protein